MKRVRSAWLLLATIALVTTITNVSMANAFSPLHQLAIRITDLRSGWALGPSVDGNGYTKESRVAFKYNLSVHELNVYGWLNGYNVAYTGHGQIDNGIQEFTVANGASWFYGVDVGNTVCSGCDYHRASAPRIGAASTYFTSANGFKGVIFRRGRYVVELFVDGTANDRSNAIALARLVSHRIARG